MNAPICFAIFLWVACSLQNASPASVGVDQPILDSDDSSESSEETNVGYFAELQNSDDEDDQHAFHEAPNGIERNHQPCKETGSLYEKFIIRYPNGSVYVPLLNKLYKVTEYKNIRNGIVVCHSNLPVSTFDNNPTIPPTFENRNSNYLRWYSTPYADRVTLTGNAICTVFLLLYYFMYRCGSTAYKDVSGYCMFNICRALLLAYACGFITYVRNPSDHCAVLGIFKTYFLLASFFWTNVMAYDTWRSLRKAMKGLEATTGNPWRYFAYAWGFSLVPISICLIVKADEASMEYQVLFLDQTCWYRQSRDLLLCFALPLVLVFCGNVVLFASSCGMMKTLDPTREDLVVEFRLSLRLGLVASLVWICGVPAMLTRVALLTYLYAFCVILQGLVIFFSHEIVGKFRNSVRRRRVSTHSNQSNTTEVLSLHQFQ